MKFSKFDVSASKCYTCLKADSGFNNWNSDILFDKIEYSIMVFIYGKDKQGTFKPSSCTCEFRQKGK